MSALIQTFGDIAEDLEIPKHKMSAIVAFLSSDDFFLADPMKQPKLIRAFLAEYNIELSTYATIMTNPSFVDLMMKTNMSLYVLPRVGPFLNFLAMRAMRDEKAGDKMITILKSMWGPLNAENQKALHLTMTAVKDMTVNQLDKEASQIMKKIPNFRDVISINGEPIEGDEE